MYMSVPSVHLITIRVCNDTNSNAYSTRQNEVHQMMFMYNHTTDGIFITRLPC